MARAKAQFAAGDRGAATRSCEEALAGAPDHPAAMQILAQCAYEDGRPVAGLELALGAVRGLATTLVAPEVAFGVWSTLNFMFTQALSGLGTATASSQRDAYHRRLDVVGDEATSLRGEVSVVLVLPTGTTARDCTATLESLEAQQLLPTELCVVTVGEAAPDPVLRARLARLPFPARVLESGAANYAAAVNAGVAATAGNWLLTFAPPHALAPDHLRSLVDALSTRGADWGFSACTWEPTGEVPSEHIAARAAAGATLQQSIFEADTVGFALIHQEFAAIGDGADAVVARPVRARRWFSRPSGPCRLGLRDAGALDGRTVVHGAPDVSPSHRQRRAGAGPDRRGGRAAASVPGLLHLGLR